MLLVNMDKVSVARAKELIAESYRLQASVKKKKKPAKR
jgi:hypothetical protein